MHLPSFYVDREIVGKGGGGELPAKRVAKRSYKEKESLTTLHQKTNTIEKHIGRYSRRVTNFSELTMEFKELPLFMEHQC